MLCRWAEAAARPLWAVDSGHSSPVSSVFLCKNKAKFNIRDLILPVKNKGKDFLPIHFLRAFTLENLWVLSLSLGNVWKVFFLKLSNLLPGLRPSLATLERDEALGSTAQVTHLENQKNVQAKKDVSSPQQAACI